MAIIKKDTVLSPYQYGDPFNWEVPDHFVSDKEKQSEKYWKTAMDYYHTQALSQYNMNAEKINRNYKLLKGFLDARDYIETERGNVAPEAMSLIDTLEESLDLPGYVKHYPILNPPINTMVGEMTKRPDNADVKAFDDESRSEKQQAMTDMFQQFMEQKIRQKVMMSLQMQGVDTSSMEQYEEQVQQITEQQMADFRTSYSTIAERWGAKVLEALKVSFNMKEQSEEAFRDLLITAQEYYHIQADSSKLGFTCFVENAKNVWKMKTPNKKYSRDWYAGGTIHVMELSEIIALYPKLTKEEVKHLNEQSRFGWEGGMGRTSPLVQKNPKTGPDSIHYDTYDPLVAQTRFEMEARMNEDALDAHLGLNHSSSYWGNKFIVVKAYWQSKKLMGELRYMDENGVEQITLVDETYKKIPEEISIKWEYINQWYEGLKIGDEVYHVQPLKILNYCPIIGVEHENKNTPVASLVDLMKPYQMIFNVCMNQLWRLLEKEKGKVFVMPLRDIPTSKDGDDQDAIDAWMIQAQEDGVIFIDDAPSNRKSASGFNQYAAHDLTRSQEMQTRLAMAEQIKNECWELVGLTRQRLGGTTSSETATSINTALTQSYAQTETYFVQHEYVCNQVYQALLDAALYVQLQNPNSTLSLISDANWGSISASDLMLRDLQVFVTSRAEDQRIFQELKMLAQPMLQNGADFTLIADMYTTTSVRQFKDSIKSFQNKRDTMMQQQQETEQQQMQQNQQQFEATMQAEEARYQQDRQDENYNAEAERLNKRQVAIISAMSKGGGDSDSDGQADAIQLQGLKQNQQKIQQDGIAKAQAAQQSMTKDSMDNFIKQQQLELDRDKLKLEGQKMQQKERDMSMKDKQHREKLAVQKMQKKSPPKKK